LPFALLIESLRRNAMQNMPPSHWDEYEPDYRLEWERAYPNTPWNDVRHGYRYGWEQAYDPQYHGREWDEVESTLERNWADWETRNRISSMGRQLQQSWEALKNSVRRGWEKARSEVENR
jgi:hypothetical protein